MAASALPGVRALATYRAAWLRSDVVAGAVLATLLVPQGMAYAELAGLPAITGLYTTVLCLVGYAVFGPSRVLVLGPDSSLGPMIAATLAAVIGAGAVAGDHAVALASMLALMVGVLMVLAGLARFGFVADLLSKPTRIGYMNGLALTIVVSQLPKLFGFSTDADKLLDKIRAFVSGVADGKTVGQALAIGLGSLAIILIVGRLASRVPGVLVAVAVSIVAASAFSLADHGVSLVGTLPSGFPPLTVPNEWSHVPALFAGAVGIVLVALADTISTAAAFASRGGREVEGNGEMVGIGAANIAAGFFQGFPVSTSGSRTAVAEQAGAKTQMTGVVGAVLIVLMLLLVPGLLRNLPQPTLAAIVIAASISLADIPGTRRLWQQRRMEFFVSLAAFLGVALLGVLQGIAIAVGVSILNVFRRVWWPHQTTLGRVDGMQGHHDTGLHPDADALPGLVIFRFDAPLLFANARTFRDQVRRLVATDPPPQWIVIAAEPITDIDTTAADMLEALDEELNAKGTSLVFAELKEPVREKLERYELIGPLNPEHFFHTLGAALDHYQEHTGARWAAPTRED